MTAEQSTMDDHKSQLHELEEIVLSYLKAVDAGDAPREEDFLKRYPDLAPELRQFFADEQRLDPVVKSLRELAPTAPHAPPKLEPFGDFDDIVEVARGGMAVVYKARQVSLKRIVAIKMIATQLQ